MVAERPVFYGIVRNGLVVPAEDVSLPDGATVEIQLIDQVAALPNDEFAAEIDAWERAGQDAWAMIEEWERTSLPEPTKA